MNVSLPSGGEVVLRDKLTAKDKFAVQGAISFSLNTVTGLQETAGSLMNDMRNALLLRLIESWTVDGLGAKPASADVLAELDLDDYNTLADAIEPILTKVVTTGLSGPNRSGQSGS